MTRHEVFQLVHKVKFRDWAFRLFDFDDFLAVQVRFLAKDSQTGRNEIQAGRVWPLLESMDEGEVIRTCLLAVLTSVEHEAREDFRVDGRAIFNPHKSVPGAIELDFFTNSEAAQAAYLARQKRLCPGLWPSTGAKASPNPLSNSVITTTAIEPST